MIKRRQSFILSLLFLALSLAYQPMANAQARCQQLFEESSPHLTRFGESHKISHLRGNGLRLLVWNIHKGTDQKLPSDFRYISQHTDLVLFQEAIDKPTFTSSLINSNKALSWTMAKAFQQSNGSHTGVSTGSKAKPLREEVLLSPSREPLLSTPKTALISEFAIENRPQTLLVANIHAINFVKTSSFIAHIEQVIAKIKNHQGPLILAGDFNTWNPWRMNYLLEAAQNLGLEKLSTPQGGLLELDHVFVKGLSQKATHNLSYIKSSDHSPLLVDLSF